MLKERLHPAGDTPLADQPAPVWRAWLVSGCTRTLVGLPLLLRAALGVCGRTNEPVWPATEAPQLALVCRW